MSDDLLNKKYTCEMEIISPLHIGCGNENNWIKGIDFVKEGKKIRKLKLKQLASIVGSEKLSSIFINRNENKLKSALVGLGNRIDEVTENLFYFDYEPSDEIKSHIKDGLSNKPYVPGSSIKGALRSILFSHLKAVTTVKEQDVFGNTKDGDEFMRFIKISDAGFEKTSLMQAKIFNLRNENNNWLGSWKHERQGGNNSSFKPSGFHTTFEVIPPQEKAKVQFMIADQTFKLFPFNVYYIDNPKLQKNLNEKDKIVGSNISYLFEIINQHTRSYIEKEIEFFEKFDQADYCSEILDYLRYLIDLTKDGPTTCLMRMASGSGFHSMTGDWRFKDHLNSLYKPDVNHKGRQTFYKSRRIAFMEYADGWDFNPMGFVLFTLVE